MWKVKKIIIYKGRNIIIYLTRNKFTGERKFSFPPIDLNSPNVHSPVYLPSIPHRSTPPPPLRSPIDPHTPRPSDLQSIHTPLRPSDLQSIHTPIFPIDLPSIYLFPPPSIRATAHTFTITMEPLGTSYPPILMPVLARWGRTSAAG